MTAEATLGETLSCKRVMVVDDDGALTELLSEFLELQGIDVVAVRSGEEALGALAHDPPPDLVLLDIKMPGISGEEVLRRMKENPRWARIPVAAMTGLRPGEFHLVANPDAFLAKPFDIGTLADALVRICRPT
ncbi:MAG TPA: response regulator [Anaeromyxobacteraceae bacterium]|nr:response regulator [Anaeromyxobacteraceae bacterium]